MPDGAVRLLLGGDVMTGRGVDQILPHPGDPSLHEHSVHDARHYVELAEALNGPIPRPVGFSWPWGDALRAIDEEAPDLRLVNLETSVTRNNDYDPGKGVHYRMNPDNVRCLTVARLDVCTLANNHVLDFGFRGLEETLDVLAAAAVETTGAGRDADEARRPVTVDASAGKITVFSVGMPSSGVPARWAATNERPGVNFVGRASDAAVADLLERVRRAKHRGDVVVVSVHWGSNWGYRVPATDVRLAHLLIDGGVDVLYGHSSHHPRPIEIYQGKLVLYGCGDLVDDYEGIAGYEKYRDDLRLLYFATVHGATGRLSTLRMVPFQARQLRLHRASAADSTFLANVLDRISRSFCSGVDVASDGTLVLKANASTHAIARAYQGTAPRCGK
jgi:poly-gamma-glutamate capsule biosynthesis protein CapA/YwtB (metallophosphatase superfamily)